jgi:hypothetical protein
MLCVPPREKRGLQQQLDRLQDSLSQAQAQQQAALDAAAAEHEQQLRDVRGQLEQRAQEWVRHEPCRGRTVSSLDGCGRHCTA